MKRIDLNCALPDAMEKKKRKGLQNHFYKHEGG